MTTYVVNSGVKLLARVDYADAAGAYAGWFLVNVDGDGLTLDLDGLGQPASFTQLDQVLFYRQPPINGTIQFSHPSCGSVDNPQQPRFRQRLLDIVHGKLEHMFGVGHSATWTATLVQGVTPAVIDDTF